MAKKSGSEKVDVMSANEIVDAGPIRRLINRAIEKAPAVKGGILVTFRPKNGGGNKHEVIPSFQADSARTGILNQIRAGFVPVA